MFERFTREARTSVKDAEAEARELGSPTIEAEHLLLALTRQDPATAVAHALAEAGLDHDRVEQALASERERSLMAVGISIRDFDLPAPHPASQAAHGGRRQERARARAADLARPRREAHRGGHILLALLRAEAGTVPRALHEAGVDRRELNDITTAVMDRSRAGPANVNCGWVGRR